jgi:glutamate racemase
MSMIGVFDSGLGGLTVLEVLVRRFPKLSFIYLGDHANVPYGDRPSEEIVALTRDGVERLFAAGCRLVLLGCNTATAMAARRLQQAWLPHEPRWAGRNVLGIVAPTVEAATRTPWAVTTPQYPQKNNDDLIIVFGTTRTVQSGVYREEIHKRCPRVRLFEHACPDLVDAIEGGDEVSAERIVAHACETAMRATGGERPDRVILGCTHYPIVATRFQAHLPDGVRVLSQPETVADSLEDYLARHPAYAGVDTDACLLRVLTTGDPTHVTAAARRFWRDVPALEAA